MEQEKIPYNINQTDAVYLLALRNGEPELPERSNNDLLLLLKETMKMADSIANNCREWLETMAICSGEIHPHNADKLNVPTVAGALSSAIAIPRVDCEGKCHTCAFRVGSPANQTEATADDILYSFSSGNMFRCHDDDSKKRACAGFSAVVKSDREAGRI